MNDVVTIGPRPVSVAKVDHELESIWKTLAPPSPDEASPVMHATVVNFVAVTDSDAAADSIVELFASTMRRAPSRFVLLNSQPEADPPGLEASVSVMCEPEGDRQSCCELIRLNATGYSADTLPTTVQAFFAPDLPIMVWWSAPLNRPDLPEFAASADRLVLDSLRYGRAELAQAAGLVSESRRTRTAVSDLNWARLTPYRQLFAQFFDSAECLTHLAKIQSVTIEAHESAALLMTGWLLSRLDREPNILRRDQLTVNVAPAGGPEFRSLVMKCKGAEFSVIRTSNDNVEARAQTPNENTSRIARVPLASLDKLLADEIGRSGRDRAYDSALKAGVTD